MGIATEQDSNEFANQKLLIELRALNDELAVPTPEQFGIERDYFFEVCPIMAEQALASGSPANNPIEPSISDMVFIYQGLWD
jgi:alcohol dehydrogenase